MFKLLGTDQKEYGPVSADQIRQWIAQGRANAQTKLQAAGSTDWKLLVEFPELADALQAAASPTGRSAPIGTSQPGGAKPKASGLAIASLVLGCLGLVTCGITSLVGLVLGIIALVRINNSQGRLGGQGVALAGTVISAVLLLLMPITAAMLLPALSKAKVKATSIQCMNNVKQLNLGLIMYANDYKDAFPSDTNWCDLVSTYVKSPAAFVCPQAKAGQRCTYAFNAKLLGRDMKDITSPAKTVLIFETDGGWNLVGGPELLPAGPRHAGASVVGFADGHVEMVRRPRLETFRWEP